MDTTAVLKLLLHGNQLKRTPRTGWVQRGVPNAENVAAHSYGVVYVVLTMAPLLDEAIDLTKALAMAALHDLPEGLTTDIPVPAWRYLPSGIKIEVERGVMQEMLGETAVASQWMAWWEELYAAESAEARLVHDADKIDMFIQVWVYARQMGNQQLAEFWATPFTFHYPQMQAVYEALRT